MSDLKIHWKEDGWWLEVTGNKSAMIHLNLSTRGQIVQGALIEALESQNKKPHENCDGAPDGGHTADCKDPDCDSHAR